MMSVAALRGDLTGWSTRWTRSMVVGVHAAFILPASVLLGLELHQVLTWPLEWQDAVLTVPVGVGLLAVQLRLSLAFAAGERRRDERWLVVALLVLIFVPMAWFGFYPWSWMEACLVATAPMVLRRGPAAALVAAVLVGTSVIVLSFYQSDIAVGDPLLTGVYWFAYVTATILLPAVGMYGSAWLVRLIETLRETRAELAAVAVNQERLRVARDLHDLLGQSLSAVSLKGDLAIRLLQTDPAAACKEIESLTGVARDALRGIRAVSRDEHELSLRQEAEGATRLLAAAGVRAHVEVDLPDLSPAVQRLLAWAVREGVVNVLRHSSAENCSVRARRRDGAVILEVANDGAYGPVGEGSGLAGLAERARAFEGSMSAGPTPEGGFRLLLEIPEEMA
jgi:two-component system sensor histidine kinase DesK